MKKSIVKIMNQSISRFFGQLSTIFGGEEVQEVSLGQPEPQQAAEVKEKQSVVESKQAVILQSQELDKEIKPESIKVKKINKKQTDKLRNKIIREPTEFIKDPRDIRDVMELMEIPFVALSKHRTAPISMKVMMVNQK